MVGQRYIADHLGIDRCGQRIAKTLLPLRVGLLRRAGVELFDVQWQTPHLASLGAVELSRSDYLRRLERAIAPDEDSADDDVKETLLSHDQKQPTTQT